MRSKVVVTTFVSAIVLLGLFVMLRQKSGPSVISQRPLANSPAQTSDAIVAVADSSIRDLAKTNPTLAAAATESAIADADSPVAKHQAYVESRVDELMELAMKDDSASLDTILAELTNRDPQIRKGALEATIQFGSRDAIPKMMDAAAQTDDPQEKAEIADAIEFLKLPSLTETIAQNRGSSGSATKSSGSKGTRPNRTRSALNSASP
jgi:hypothetical protein